MSGSFGLIFDTQKKILLVKRRDMPLWVLPGGHVEKGETPEQACVREVYEETGFNVAIIRKVGHYLYTKSKAENITFECVIKSGVKTTSNESSAIEYFDILQLPYNVSPYVSAMVNDALKHASTTIEHTFPKLPLRFWLKTLLHPFGLFKYLLTRVGIHWNT